ncbi:MAG: 6-phosphogluconolactonase [Magnetococcales bacterium]|nr:6-phosphogluconolactonase [Magnetococcales bacterium]
MGVVINMHSINIHISCDSDQLVWDVAKAFRRAVEKKLSESGFFFVALSGGTTPRKLYEVLSLPSMRDLIPWKRIHIFLGDERCVESDHPESNFKMVREALLDRISIPRSNIHPINGDVEPEQEASRYSGELLKHLPLGPSQLPQFDFIFLGLGTDGHTASIFPNDTLCVLSKERILFQVAKHPITQQKRITLTLVVINEAIEVAFVVSGANKASVIEDILMEKGRFSTFPATYVRPKFGKLTWYLDSASVTQKTLSCCRLPVTRTIS